MTTDLPNNKRPLSVSTEPSLDDGNEYPFLPPINSKTILTNNTKASIPTTSKKCPKRSQSLTRFIENLDETLKPIKPILNDKNNNFILDFHQFKSLLENACSIENPFEITKDYTQDTNALLHMIETMHPILKDRSVKNRVRRLAKKLAQAQQITTVANIDPSIPDHTPNWFSDSEYESP